MPPLIGITTSELRSPSEHANRDQSEPPMRELALGLTYPRAIAAAGGVPVVIPPFCTDEEIAGLVERLDGVCLAGGPDLHPSYYGQDPHPNLGPTERDLDSCELALVSTALDRGLPLLCICRGAQALNVVRGGTLLQDVPGHRQVEPGRLPTHRVLVEPGSRLAGALGSTDLEVNSFHHQAVDTLGAGLRVVARDPDGLVEGIEAVDHEFVLGVQWHAEGLVHGAEQRALFGAFIAAAEGFGVSGARRAA
jgi:putative glutamine amidotransferase